MKSRADLPRSPVRRSQPRRDWTLAREKVEQEGRCRLCKIPERLEAAHVISRDRDKFAPVRGAFLSELATPKAIVVQPERIVPLCPIHHRLYDAHEVDLLPALTVEEQAQAVVDAGGIELARRRTAPLAYRSEAA